MPDHPDFKKIVEALIARYPEVMRRLAEVEAEIDAADFEAARKTVMDQTSESRAYLHRIDD
jgi:hypothetical protein